MLRDVVSVKVVDEFQLILRFEDEVEGLFDMRANIKFDGIFAPLRDPEYFGQATVNPELGTVVWPNGADLDPVVLYAAVTGQPCRNVSESAVGA